MERSFDAAERRRLGLYAPITRRDFLNGTLVGAAGMTAPAVQAATDSLWRRRLFGVMGFRPGRDLAAIVPNRWGHARLIEPPGFHYGSAAHPSPLERVRPGYGRIGIGHSELNGAQHWGSALEYDRKAAEQVAAFI